jgi:hypothetical protein
MSVEAELKGPLGMEGAAWLARGALVFLNATPNFGRKE